MRTGIGYDLHRLVQGRPLILGGVTIPYERGLAGHSDADVLAHAIIDALLGASGLGNIGQLFPDTDPTFKNADSMVLLRKTVQDVRNNGYRIANIDAVVIAEHPRLNPYLAAIQTRLAEALTASSNSTIGWLPFAISRATNLFLAFFIVPFTRTSARSPSLCSEATADAACSMQPSFSARPGNAPGHNSRSLS